MEDGSPVPGGVRRFRAKMKGNVPHVADESTATPEGHRPDCNASQSNPATLFTPPLIHHPPRISGPAVPLNGISLALSTEDHQTSGSGRLSEVTPLLASEFNSQDSKHTSQSTSLIDLFEPPRSDSSLLSTERTPRVSTGSRKGNHVSRTASASLAETGAALPSIQELPVNFGTTSVSPGSRGDCWHRCWFLDWRFIWDKSKDTCRATFVAAGKSSTWIGALMFLLYHVVFCLTMGSTITRTHGGGRSMIGLMTKTSAMGIMFSAPLLCFTLGDDIPALYPTVDLFTAPFFARMGQIVDESLYEEYGNDPSVGQEEREVIFLTTFTLLVSLSLAIAGLLLATASVFKLADLASFLPTSVISGFFSAVGVMMWTLAVKVDTNGLTVQHIVGSRDVSVIGHALLHHLPSVAIASTMKYLGPKHPFWVAGIVLATIAAFHGTMFAFGMSMDVMVERKWFWSKDDLLYHGKRSQIGFEIWAPPVPAGWINSVLHGNVHWTSVVKALETSIAFAFLYLIRCSVHGAALRKNVSNLQRIVKVPNEETQSHHHAIPLRAHRRKFSEHVDLELVGVTDSCARATVIEAAPNTRHTMKNILHQYGITQCISALAGSFAIVPSVAASSTLYKLHAETIAPQLGSVLLLTGFFMSDFQLVRFIPKPAFSALLILAFIDMIMSWFIKSYMQTKEKLEWLVVPLIVIFASVVGLLGAVFLGISFSTFFFVASFFRSGVVKYLATGLTVRSTIERPFEASQWLDQNGELIQVIVLQNYLFFGNASSILNYVSSMFEETQGVTDELLLPPFPRIVVLDLTLVSGMDGSAVDVVSDILGVCKSKQCKLFLSGVSVNARQAMALRGLKPEEKKDRSARALRFFSDLDAAVGKAEDFLLNEQALEASFSVAKASGDSGFVYSLRVIDNQHGTAFGDELAGLEGFTEVLTLEPGEVLYDQQNLDRGLFFIEEGTMKIDRVSEITNTRSGMGTSTYSLNQLKARSTTIGRHLAGVKAMKEESPSQTFRVARVGPGWVLGTIEALSGLINPGSTVAVDACRLHYISFKSLEEIESKYPELTLKLYKLLSLLMAKRQEITISHLATLHSIMASPALKKPVSRNEVQSLRRGLLGQPL